MSKPHILRLMASRGFHGARYVKPEAAMCIDLANRLRVATIEGRAGGVWHHNANEGKLSKTVRALLAAMGLISGVGDYFFSGDNGGYIEMKAGRGVLSDNQKDFRDWCSDSGVRWAMCRSADEAEATLKAWGWLA